LQFEDIANRITKLGVDADAYKALCADYFSSADAHLKFKAYLKFKQNGKLKQLKSLAEQCAGKLPKFNKLGWEEVILDTLASIKLPRKKFNYVFGHADEEKTLYPAILRFLKSKYKSEEVFDTSNVRSKFVRFADFTVAKRGLTGTKILSLDAKTNPAAFDRFLNQADDFHKFSEEVYLIATPGLILEAGKKYGQVSDAESKVIEKLKGARAGAYIIDKTSGEFSLRFRSESNGVDKHAKKKALEELSLL
jgi:hypothetical protein